MIDLNKLISQLSQVVDTSVIDVPKYIEELIQLLDDMDEIVENRQVDRIKQFMTLSFYVKLNIVRLEILAVDTSEILSIFNEISQKLHFWQDQMCGTLDENPTIEKQNATSGEVPKCSKQRSLKIRLTPLTEVGVSKRGSGDRENTRIKTNLSTEKFLPFNNSDLENNMDVQIPKKTHFSNKPRKKKSCSSKEENSLKRIIPASMVIIICLLNIFASNLIIIKKTPEFSLQTNSNATRVPFGENLQ